MDNTRTDKTRKVVFGYTGSDPYNNLRPVRTSTGAVGIGQGLETAIVTDAPGAAPVLGAPPPLDQTPLQFPGCCVVDPCLIQWLSVRYPSRLQHTGCGGQVLGGGAGGRAAGAASCQQDLRTRQQRCALS